MPIPALVIAVVAAVGAVALTLLFMPKPKARKNDAMDDFENPTAEAGRPVPVVFGTITVKGLNVLWFGNKQAQTYKTSAGGGKK